MRVMVRKSPVRMNPNIRLLLNEGIIRKSHGLYCTETGEMMGLGNPDVLREDHDHPWYDQWDDEGLGLRAHHPLHAQDGAGNLLWNDDGTPRGKHPIDAMMSHLGKMLGSFWGRPELGEHMARIITQSSIEDYNDEHGEDGNHRLSHIDSAQWRRNYMVPYDNVAADATERRLRGAERHLPEGPRPQGTYNLNSANPKGSRATGLWGDSGLIPMNRQIGRNLHRVNQWMGEQGYPMIPDKDINRLQYVHKPYIGVDKMTDNRIVPLTKQHAFHMQSMGRMPTGLTPADEMDDIVDSPQLVHRLGVAAAGLHPAMTSVATAAGRPPKIRENSAREGLAEAGIEVSDEEFANFIRMPLSTMLFGRPNESGTLPDKILNTLEQEIEHAGGKGIDRDSPAYNQIISRMQRAGNLHGGKDGQSEFARKYAAFARLVGLDAISAHEYIPPGHESSEEHDELAQRIISGLLEHAGLEAHDYDHQLEPLPPNIPDIAEHNVHEAFHPHIMTALELAPHGNQPMMPQPPPPPPPETDLVSFAQQLQQRPAYTSPDVPMGPSDDSTLFQRSERDIRGAIMRVQKAMEKIQLEEAMNESEIKKYLPNRPLSNSLDLNIFAKSMNLTSHDIWAINSSKGDWEEVAKSWQVPIGIVKAIKLAMGDYHG